MFRKVSFEDWFNDCSESSKKNLKYFSLTTQMIEKNDFSDHQHFVITAADSDGTSGIAIFNVLNKNSVNIDSLEIRKDCQKQGLGRKIVNSIKRLYPTIFVSETSPESESFYQKLNFTNESSIFTWRKHER